MNYQERILKLKTFKSEISGGATENSTEGFSNEVSDWTGGNSKKGYNNYVKIVKKDAEKIAKKKAIFLVEIDKQISLVQKQFNQEYNAHLMHTNSIYESDPEKRKTKKREYINKLNIDSSVKAKLRSSIN
ncbi:hypothetical protein [Carnobacterium maltaromaticum]|uniref:hypothetical protein n=1 Tax=Carnobacterium maltaromaticum TaxID=2751 RepID=UPI00295EB1FC|nr:hypothetical protein [Carnobacterium maltaromaticum]